MFECANSSNYFSSKSSPTNWLHSGNDECAWQMIDIHVDVVNMFVAKQQAIKA